ncbi:MAG TPA: substrate-binding domain-containing protein [Streptosporangiaceae bacterium]|jgi:molybdate-binding protein/transcriptional regulator with XRE-family HTH domain
MTADGGRLRLARQARGLSQQQLAGMAGVSRQAVSAVESGVSDPSLRVALALAQALGTSIEEVFGPAPPSLPVTARPLAPLGEPGSRVALAPVSDAFVALPLSDATARRAGFAPAGGLVQAAGSGQPEVAGGQAGEQAAGQARHLAERQVRPIGPPRPTLVVAGCDPAMPLLESPLSLLDPPVAFAWWPCGSEEALGLAAAGLVHAAGAHLRSASGDYNTAAARQLLPGGAEVIGFCAWREGLVLRPELAGRLTGIADLLAGGLRLVNREPGAEARHLLDRELARLGIDPAAVAGYETKASGHLEVAAAVAAGLADAGIASEPAALAYHLAFVPLAAEVFDWVIPAAQNDTRAVQCLLRVLSSPWLLDQLANLPGYDPGRCGRHIATLPAAGRRGLARARGWRPTAPPEG